MKARANLAAGLVTPAIAAGACVEFLHVPYRGGSEAPPAVLAGAVDGVCDVPAFGEVPAIARFDIRSWNMITLPAGTAGGERARLFAALTLIGRDEGSGAALHPLSYDAVVSDTPEAAQRFINEEAPRWRELIRPSGTRAQ